MADARESQPYIYIYKKRDNDDEFIRTSPIWRVRDHIVGLLMKGKNARGLSLARARAYIYI